MKLSIRFVVVVLVAAFGLLTRIASSQGQPQAAWTWNRDFWNVPIPIGGSKTGMTVYDSGSGPELFVCGDFWGSPGEADWVARWSPATGWRGLGPPWLNDYVNDIEVYDDGTGPALYAGGWFDHPPSDIIARWEPSLGWHKLRPPGSTSGCSLGGSLTDVSVLGLHDDGTGLGLYIGGAFSGGICSGIPIPSRNIIRYDGTGFHSLAGGVDHVNGAVKSLCSFDDGSGPALYVGGLFTSIGGVPMNGIARWNGSAWSQVGNLQPDQDWYVLAMAVFDDGAGLALYCATRITSIGATYLAKWDGTQWHAINPQPPGGVGKMFVFDDGRGPALFCWVGSGDLSMLLGRWDGTRWTGLGQGLLDSNPYIGDMAIYDAGRGPELHFCGGFATAGGGIPARGVASWRNAQGPIDSMCPGDQTYAPCPCAGFGAPLHGCPNSFDPSGALLTPTGATADDSLTFTATSLPPNALGVLFQGDQFLSTGTVAPGGGPIFGDGLRCASGTLRRLYTKSAVGGQITAPEPGEPTIRAQALAAGDTLGPGSERFYQLWYRDSAPAFCITNAFSNTTNGVRVVW